MDFPEPEIKDGKKVQKGRKTGPFVYIDEH